MSALYAIIIVLSNNNSNNNNNNNIQLSPEGELNRRYS